MDLDAYRDYYESTYVPLLLGMGRPGPPVYRRLHFDNSKNIRKENPIAVAFDSVAFMSFPSESVFEMDALGSLKDEELSRKMMSSEDEFMNRDARLVFAVKEYISMDA